MVGTTRRPSDRPPIGMQCARALRPPCGAVCRARPGRSSCDAICLPVFTRTNGVHALTLVHREDHGMAGRVDVEADDVAHLDLEPRVAGDLEGLHLLRPEAVVPQDAVHGGDRHSQPPRQRPHRPVPGVLRRRRHHQRDRGLQLVLGDRLLPRRTGVSRRSPSTPSTRKRSHKRQTVGFDMPVRRMVSDRPLPEPSSRI